MDQRLVRAAVLAAARLHPWVRTTEAGYTAKIKPSSTTAASKQRAVRRARRQPRQLGQRYRGSLRARTWGRSTSLRDAERPHRRADGSVPSMAARVSCQGRFWEALGIDWNRFERDIRSEGSHMLTQCRSSDLPLLTRNLPGRTYTALTVCVRFFATGVRGHCEAAHATALAPSERQAAGTSQRSRSHGACRAPRKRGPMRRLPPSREVNGRARARRRCSCRVDASAPRTQPHTRGPDERRASDQTSRPRLLLCRGEARVRSGARCARW
jgi:hypothetical protein